jgi:hypothetical protein
VLRLWADSVTDLRYWLGPCQSLLAFTVTVSKFRSAAGRHIICQACQFDESNIGTRKTAVSVFKIDPVSAEQNFIISGVSVARRVRLFHELGGTQNTLTQQGVHKSVVSSWECGSQSQNVKRRTTSVSSGSATVPSLQELVHHLPPTLEVH